MDNIVGRIFKVTDVRCLTNCIFGTFKVVEWDDKVERYKLLGIEHGPSEDIKHYDLNELRWETYSYIISYCEDITEKFFIKEEIKTSIGG